MSCYGVVGYQRFTRTWISETSVS